MTGQRVLDAAVLAVSFLNMMLLLWLGLMVLLNAERRAWGIWVATAGLLAGAAFLIIHSTLYAGAWVRVSLGLSLGWHLGWVLALALPLTWYLNMLWYAGYWEDAGPLRRHQAPWLRLTVLAGLGLLALLVFANPLPSYSRIVDYETAGGPSLSTVPLVILAFPLYILLCTGLSVNVLLRPAPSGRVMGDLARRRARPWLLGTSLALLAVSLLVACVVTWLFLQLRYGAVTDRMARLAVPVAWFDLAIDSVLAGGILLLGQAMVAYEIFTGSALPRRGLRRHWRVVVLLAAALSLIAAVTLIRGIQPATGLLMAGGLVAFAFALMSRQSFAERERYIEHLRPFVASLRLYEHLLGRAGPEAPETGVATAFQALCDDVLGARVAYLAALGRLTPLMGPPLSQPPGLPAPLAALPKLWPQLEATPGLCLPVDPAAFSGANWAVPLRSEGQLVGALLLGEKRDGGLYTQEEIEVARASGERLIDTAASAELARRLMALQRQRLAESQVLDQQARRVLHDQVLPRLHTAILSLAAQGSDAGDAAETLAEVHRGISDLLRAMPTRVDPDLARLGLVGALRQAVERELAGEFQQVTWEIDPEGEARMRAIPPRFGEVLFFAAREAARNAARYGRGNDPTRPLSLRIALSWQGGLQLLIEDNGVGTGGAEPAAAGAGQGLALHSTLMAVIGGALAVESVPGEYTRVTLSLPQEAC